MEDFHLREVHRRKKTYSLVTDISRCKYRRQPKLYSQGLTHVCEIKREREYPWFCVREKEYARACVSALVINVFRLWFENGVDVTGRERHVHSLLLQEQTN